MHSFDQKLLDLDEKLKKSDGKPLKVCKPAMGGPSLPLLEPPRQILDSSEDDEEVLAESEVVAGGPAPYKEDEEAIEYVIKERQADGAGPAPQPESESLQPVDNGNAKAEP